jgi:hypothetical protein
MRNVPHEFVASGAVTRSGSKHPIIRVGDQRRPRARTTQGTLSARSRQQTLHTRSVLIFCAQTHLALAIALIVASLDLLTRRSIALRKYNTPNRGNRLCTVNDTHAPPDIANTRNQQHSAHERRKRRA